jgi:hypothetical protein
MNAEREIDTVDMIVHVGVFANRSAGDAAVQDLLSAGVPADRIGMLSKTDRPKNDFGLENDPTESRWEEGTAIGATAGAVTGASLGLAVAGGLMPPVGPVIAGGMLLAMLASVGTGAAVGTVVGGLIGLGIPEAVAHHLGEQVASGRTLVAVRTEGQTPWIDILLRHHGASEYRQLISSPG